MFISGSYGPNIYYKYIHYMLHSMQCFVCICIAGARVWSNITLHCTAQYYRRYHTMIIKLNFPKIHFFKEFLTLQSLRDRDQKVGTDWKSAHFQLLKTVIIFDFPSIWSWYIEGWRIKGHFQSSQKWCKIINNNSFVLKTWEVYFQTVLTFLIR